MGGSAWRLFPGESAARCPVTVLKSGSVTAAATVTVSVSVTVSASGSVTESDFASVSVVHRVSERAAKVQFQDGELPDVEVFEPRSGR